jgi:Flp pilus assembly protein TadG
MRFRRRRQRGQAIIVVALMAMLLFGLAAIAIDASLTMADRRRLQASVDTAALAGAISYPSGPSTAHWIAMQYLQQPLAFTLPLGTCANSANCPAGSYTTGTYTITIADAATNQMDLTVQHTEPGVFAGLIGAAGIQTGSSVRAQAPGPTIIPADYGAIATTGGFTVAGGGGSTRNFGNGVYAASQFGANNPPHSDGINGLQTDFNGNVCPGNVSTHVDLGAGSNPNLNWAWIGAGGTTTFNVPVPGPYDNVAPTTSGPTYTVGTYLLVGQGKDLSGNWNPGIYDGVFPSVPGKLNPGVYKLINVTTPMAFGALTNAIYTAPGTEDANGAIVIVLDSSDTGSIDISSVTLNGLDDLHPQSYVGPRDPQGTHNFVFYGGNGATGYTGSIDFGPGTNASLSGIFYMPKFAITSHGNPTFTFTGQITVASMDLKGGGANGQVINWVCGLGAILGNPSVQGGLNR